MSIVNHQTGEISVVSHQERAAVARLTTAITALTEAVDFMPINEVASLKGEMATIQTATKELGMSKEAQELSAEAVRRCQWTLRKAATRDQELGKVATRSSSLVPGARTGGPASRSSSDLPSPKSFFGSVAEYEDANAMAELDADQFDGVLAEAKAEGNLSRANVARKAREQADPARRTAPNRRALPDVARDLGIDLRRLTERFERLQSDDRFGRNKNEVAAHLRHHLAHALQVLTDLEQEINSTQKDTQ